MKQQIKDEPEHIHAVSEPKQCNARFPIVPAEVLREPWDSRRIRGFRRPREPARRAWLVRRLAITTTVRPHAGIGYVTPDEEHRFDQAQLLFL